MNRRFLMLAALVIAAGVLTFYAANRVTAATEDQKDAAGSVRDLQARISKLETQFAALQAKVRQLESQAHLKVLTIPDTHNLQGNKLPPGAAEHTINGLKYWTIPIKETP